VRISSPPHPFSNALPGFIRDSCCRALCGPHQLSQNFLELGIGVHRLCQLADDFTLSFNGDLAIARERRKHLFVAEVLAPGLELLRRAAELLAQLGKRLSKAMRIEVGEPGTRERILENLPDRTRAAPMLVVETGCLEMAAIPDRDLRCREQRIVEALEKPVQIEFKETTLEDAIASLQKIADVPMPGPAVRFDYQSMDSGSGRLYIAHMNAGQLVIFDTAQQQVVANLDGFKGVHGVWAAPEIDRVFASVTGEHSVAVVDSKTLRTCVDSGKYKDLVQTDVLEAMKLGASGTPTFILGKSVGNGVDGVVRVVDQLFVVAVELDGFDVGRILLLEGYLEDDIAFDVVALHAKGLLRFQDPES